MMQGMQIHHAPYDLLSIKYLLIFTISDDFDLGGYGKINFDDLQDQVVKTYQAGAFLKYKPIRLSMVGEAQGRIDSPGRVVPAWIPGSENRQTFRLHKGI